MPCLKRSKRSIGTKSFIGSKSKKVLKELKGECPMASVNYDLDLQTTEQEIRVFLQNYNNPNGINHLTNSLSPQLGVLSANAVVIPPSDVPVTAIRLIYHYASSRTVKTGIIKAMNLSNQYFKQITFQNYQYLDALRFYLFMSYFNNNVSNFMSTLDTAYKCLVQDINQQKNSYSQLVVAINNIPAQSRWFTQIEKSALKAQLQAIISSI